MTDRMNLTDSLAKIRQLLTSLYGEVQGKAAFQQIRLLIDHYQKRMPEPHQDQLRHSDAVLITYGDQVKKPGEAPLHTLSRFCEEYIFHTVSSVHILPFYPYTSDDGFSVVDYKEVDPALGEWDDIAAFGRRFRLMFDGVINHISAQSTWFKGYCAGDPQFADFFISVPEGADLTRVIRPRTLPLLTTFTVQGKPQAIWTTFSADQVDLNYANPAVLIKVLDSLLFYVQKGARLIRLDAIAFLWKTPGTTCLHLPQTHQVIQLIRSVLDLVDPFILLITETNVPHGDNISYFGDGFNEAQMVYNFALPPLVLHTLQTANAEALTRWASDLTLPSQKTTFFNFLASHDGIGLNPVRGILSQSQVDALVERALAHGGLVSYKNNPDGSTSPYELNVNYFDALNNPADHESLETQVARFIASQAIMLSLVGVPGIYFHSLFGSQGWREGVQQTGQNRTINRQKKLCKELETELGDSNSLRNRIFTRYSHLLQVRTTQPAFDPYGEMKVINAGNSIFAVLRTAEEGWPVLCLQNVSNQAQPVPQETITFLGRQVRVLTELVSGAAIHPRGVMLNPYQTLWLTIAG